MSTVQNEYDTGLRQTVIELARGLIILGDDLRVHARINSAAGRREIETTMNTLKSIVGYQDAILAVTVAEPVSGRLT